MLILLFEFHYLIALATGLVLIPQGILFYKFQQQAFEVLVSNSPESRKLNYYSNVSLSHLTIKEMKMYHLHQYFIDKYHATYSTIIKKIQTTRFKQFRVSVLFLFVTALISIVSFYYVLTGVLKGNFEHGAILVFSSSIVYSMQSTSRIVEESSLLYDTLLYMQRYFNFIEFDMNTTQGDQYISEFNNLSITNLNFKYPSSDTLVLDSVSFSINSGEKLPL